MQNRTKPPEEAILNPAKILFAKFLAYLPSFIAQFVTLNSHSRIGKWYNSNGIFKYPKETIIALNHPYAFGYGIRPVGVVKGYTEGGGYIIQMERDYDGNYFDWMTGRHTQSVKRITELEEHFKWNVEYHFRAIPAFDLALAYA